MDFHSLPISAGNRGGLSRIDFSADELATWRSRLRARLPELLPAWNAALAYDEAYRRNRQGGRAPEALLGLSGAFSGFNARREACDTLDQLRSEFPRLSPPLAQRAEQARRANGCR